MDILLESLRPLAEYRGLAAMLEARQAAAVSGVGEMTRSHLIASLHRDSGRPVVVVCQDETAARRVQAELAAFLDETPPILPGREFTFYDAAGVSRGWEQQRLRLLYELGQGRVPVLLAGLDALTLRTMPRAQLFSAAVTLRPGAEYDLDELTEKLVRAGYTRSSLVEGVGQFALRGGILDVFSPACDNPVRAEFFGDELDTMGFFDPITQRRTENADEAVLLPVAETEPHLHPEGLEGLLRDLNALIARQKRRKTPNARLIETLERDAEKLGSDVLFPAADRYMALIYPEFTTAADYISQDADVFFCDHGNLQRAAKARTEDFGLSLDSFLESGQLAGELCEFVCSFEELAAKFRGRGAAYLDKFLSAQYPEELAPKQIFSITARQLPGYGGSLDTAVQDLQHYQKNGYRSLVLCGGRRRGEILKDMLQKQGVDALLAFPATALPQPGQVLITDGSLPAGMEYPELRLAVLTEGQLLARQERRRPAHKKATNRQKLDSFTDLTPGDLVVHEHHGIGRYVGMEQMKVGGALKDYVKIAYQGTDFLYVPATQLDLVSKYIGSGGEDSPVRLSKLGGDQWQKTKARAKSRGQGSRQGAHPALRRAQAPAGLRLRGGLALAEGVRGELRVRRDGRPAALHRGDQKGHGGPRAHGPPALRRRRLRQDRGRAPRGDEVHPRRQAGRHPRADDRARPAALSSRP
jgi:transcription-repair coupling factor (superfamily II helicase)